MLLRSNDCRITDQLKTPITCRSQSSPKGNNHGGNELYVLSYQDTPSFCQHVWALRDCFVTAYIYLELGNLASQFWCRTYNHIKQRAKRPRTNWFSGNWMRGELLQSNNLFFHQIRSVVSVGIIFWLPSSERMILCPASLPSFPMAIW